MFCLFVEVFYTPSLLFFFFLQTLQQKVELAQAACLSCPFHGMGDVIETLVQVCSEM